MPTASTSTSAPTTPLFDAHGRLVPLADDAVYSRVDRRYFSLGQPAFDFRSIHAAIGRHLGRAAADACPSAGDFERRCVETRAALADDPATAGLFSGVHVPFLLPPGQADMVAELETVLLPAVGKAYVEKLPGFTFTDHTAGQCPGGLRIVPGTRYERLVERHRTEPVLGWYFPVALSGFAVPAQRRAIARLPERLGLAGPLEAAAAFIGVPDILMRADNYPNLLALTAVEPADPKFFHFFEAYGWNLTYNLRSMVGAVSEYFAGGLVALA